MPLHSSKSLRRAVPACAAIAGLALAAPGSAGANPTGECREVSCAGTVAVGQAPVSWASPQTFYPHNEAVFASPSVGSLVLSEVRVFGPELCRHRFVGASITVVIRACGAQTPLRVRATRRKAGTRNLAITYAARPILDNTAPGAQPPPPGSVFDGLRQITGLLMG